MVRVKLCVAIVLLSLVEPMITFSVTDGVCPTNITSIGKFDMERYLGKWYIYSMFSPFTKPMPHCKSNQFTKDKRGSYFVTSKELEFDTKTVTKHTLKIKSVNSNLGQYIFNHKPRTFPRGVQIYILNTDYTNYTIEYTCINSDGVFNMQWAVIGTRKRVPTESTVYIARKLAKQSGLAMNRLIPVQQDSCPTDT
ncbi:apolipoprotein D [Drosophila nasuta]|uniref:apolipoprotein D n=1 Tax=Drosophila nasuta TaxID=42062 RepID=UPI00295ED4CD|nr:apolipoprotein D [Drosophila nasuta]